MSNVDHELRMAILSSNCLSKTREEIDNYGKLSSVPVLHHQKDSRDLGILCGKPFPVSTIVISDPGDSKILDLTRE
jgi:large subunit ribosomal protein L30e